MSASGLGVDTAASALTDASEEEVGKDSYDIFLQYNQSLDTE